jgi:hypothetical protein
MLNLSDHKPKMNCTPVNTGIKPMPAQSNALGPFQLCKDRLHKFNIGLFFWQVFAYILDFSYQIPSL